MEESRKYYNFIKVLKFYYLICTLIIPAESSEGSSMMIADLGVMYESVGRIFLNMGYTHHSIVIGMPDKISISDININCKEHYKLYNEYSILLDSLYERQMEILKEDIPESDLRGLLDNDKMKKYSTNKKEHVPNLATEEDKTYKDKTRIHNITNKYEGVMNKKASNAADALLPTTYPITEGCTDDVRLVDNGTYTVYCPCLEEYKEWRYHENPLITGNMDRLCYNEPSRKKRELITLAVAAAVTLIGASTALAISNKADVGVIESHMSLIDNKLDEIAHSVNNMNKKNEMIVDRLNNVTSVALPYMFKEIQSLRQMDYCSKEASAVFTMSAIAWLSSVPSKISRIMNSAYSGKITPDIFTKRMINEMLLEREDFAHSPYIGNEELVYEVGRFIIVQVKHKPFMLHGIMILPTIHHTPPHFLYKVNRVNFIYRGENSILDLPEIVAKYPRDDIFWNVNSNSCSYGIRFSICPIDLMKTTINNCAGDMLAGERYDRCHVKGIPSEELMLVQTSKGLLVGSSNKTYRLISHDKIMTPSVVNKILPGAPIILPKGIAEYVEIENNVYSLQDTHIIRSILSDLISVNYTWNNFTDESLFPSYTPLNNDPEKTVEDIEKYHRISHYGFSLFSICGLLLLFYYLRRMRKNTIHRQFSKPVQVEMMPIV